jgi:Tol biopolymer transport system component
VIPALQRDRIWVIDAESPNPDGVNYTTSLRELDLNSHETASIVFPCCRTLIGQSEQGLVVASASGLEVIDPLTGTVIASDPDVMYPEAVDRSNVLYSKRSPACGETENQQIWLLDLATGAKRPFAGCYSRVGGFSPDGRSISLWTSGDGASATLTIMSLDGSERIEVPDSRSAEYRVAWDPEGRRLYFADSTGLNIRSFDLTTQESQLVVRLDGLVVALSATD